MINATITAYGELLFVQVPEGCWNPVLMAHGIHSLSLQVYHEFKKGKIKKWDSKILPHGNWQIIGLTSTMDADSKIKLIEEMFDHNGEAYAIGAMRFYSATQTWEWFITKHLGITDTCAVLRKVKH